MKKKKPGDLADDILDDLLSGESSMDELTGSGLILTDDNDDKTLQLTDEQISGVISPESLPEEGPQIFGAASKTEPLIKKGETVESLAGPRDGKTLSEKVKTSVGRFFPSKSPVVGVGDVASAGHISLAQSEHLRVAQNRIIELESRIQTLRSNNDSLLAAGEIMKKRADDLTEKYENAGKELKSQKKIVLNEQKISQAHSQKKDREFLNLKQSLDESEARLSANMHKIRVREKELENRLELVKMESAALIQNKNEIILDLKRSMDQLNIELDNYRAKGQELNAQIDNKQEVLRRTIRTLRIALVMLEGDESVDESQKNTG